MKTQHTLGEWLQRWIDTYAPIRCTSGVTLERYQRLANYLLSGATAELAQLSNTLLTELRHQTIESSLLTLLTAPAIRRQCISRRSIRHIGALLSVALEKAARLEVIPFNPMGKVELPPAEASQARSLTIEELKRLRQVCRGDWTLAFIELAMSTGCRRGELLALRWDDLVHSTRVLSITKSLEETNKGGLKLKKPKNGKARAFTLPHSVMLLLPTFDEQGHRKTGLIFPNEKGQWRSPALVSQTVVRRMRKAGIPDASLHALRHTHASHLISRGMPVPAVSKRLGHTDPALTMRVYAHALPLDDQRLADEWDDIAGSF